ncbi:MAG TPA: serine/threonine-protein kinase, partial [Thermoanaerobaculia bacterium]|nr:serine/threonine-protein kinase [Thermoanaerobaculia bacterium]
MTERLKEGDHLGPYRIESFLGEGGMGQVYRAIDPSLGRPVALKLIAGRGEREEATARLVAEARLAAALNHPNICTVYQVGDARGMHFIAMELVEGTPLSARIAKGPLAPREVARIGAALASALAVAHDRGILHRDLKPDNVFLTNDGTPKLLDFGLAKRIIAVDGEAKLTTDGLLRGTPSYMSPEQATLQSLDARSDIFSLGIVLYEMATGVRPFLAETPTKELIRIARDEPMAAEALVPSIPPALGNALRKCLEKDPGDR